MQTGGRVVGPSERRTYFWWRLATTLALVFAVAGVPLSVWAEETPGSSVQPAAQTAEAAADLTATSGTSPEPAQEGVGATEAWPQFKGPRASGVTTASTPTDGGALAWGVTPDNVIGFSNRSDPIVIGDKLYMVETQTLYQLNVSDGKTYGSIALDAPIDSTCRTVYDQASGLVLVPLRGGRVEAVHVGADGLQKAWTSELLDSGEQTLTTPLLSGGRLYLGTTDGGNPSKRGHLACLDVATGSLVWSLSQDTGYYWAGAVMTSRGLLMGDDAGNLTLRNPDTGDEIAHINLGGLLRTTTVLSDDGSKAYAVTRDDGVLHIVDVATMAEVGSVKACDSSTSTPTVDGSMLYLGGLKGQHGGIFAVDVSDPAKPWVSATITSLQTGATVGEVKSTPLVSRQASGTYVYFSANDNNGALYVWKVGDVGFRLLYQPHQREWCFGSVICDGDGGLYYSNDSSVLFKVAKPVSEPSKQKSQPHASRGAGARGTGSKKKDDGGESTAPAASNENQPARGQTEATSDASDSAKDTPEGDTQVESTPETSSQVEDSQPVMADPAQEPERSIPVWPIVGIAVGAVVIVLALAWPWLMERWRNHGRRA